MNKTKMISVKHLYIGGAAIFLLGVVLGAVLLLANFGFIMHALRPERKDMAEMLANEVSVKLNEQFELPKKSLDRIKEIIVSSQPRIEDVLEETHLKIEALQQDLIENIAQEIPDHNDRRIFLEDGDKFFPPLPHKGAPPPPIF